MQRAMPPFNRGVMLKLRAHQTSRIFRLRPLDALPAASLQHVYGMDSKTDRIRAAWAAGDQISALRIAARFFDRSFETRTFKRGMSAYNNPSFYRQLGKDPVQIVADALNVMAKRFGLR
jgi:hypothetical protein